jgi:DNA-binding response OmpR family regulator
MTPMHEEEQHHRTTSTLQPGPVLAGHIIQSSEERHLWIIDQILIPCSAPEYRCLKLLLEQESRCVPYLDLLVCLQKDTSGKQITHAERMRLAHLLSLLRAKIWALGLDIVSVRNIGYILLACGSEEAIAPRSALSPDS